MPTHEPEAKPEMTAEADTQVAGAGASTGSSAAGAADPAGTADPIHLAPLNTPTEPTDSRRGPRRNPRPGTVIVGVFFAVIGALGLLAVLSGGGLHVDTGAVVAGIVTCAGLALLISGILTAIRSREKE